MIQKKDRSFTWCILLSAVMGLLCFGFFAWRSGGFFTLMDDFNSQELTFPAALQEAFKGGGTGPWFWNLDLGASVVTGFSFYNLGSVFYWISFLFPKTFFPYLVPFLFVLKYVVASATAFCYLRYFIKDGKITLIAALLYAYSGFQTTNILFYHFHDVVAFFPLLLLSLERMMESKKARPFFIFAVFLNCVTNYFFFIQEVIFLVLYFLFRFSGRPLKKLAADALWCILCGAVGVGMAAFLFVPSIRFVMSNTRSSSNLYLSNLIDDTRKLLFRVKGMILPGDNMSDQSILISQNWSSTSCYLPFFGLSFVLAYLAKKKNWLKYLILVLLLVSFSPLLQSGFLLFTASYQRWWYMLVLMMSLATAYVLEDWRSYQLPRYLAGYAVFLVIFYLAMTLLPWSKDSGSLVFHGKRFLLFTGIALLGVLILYGMVKLGRVGSSAIAACVVAFCVGTTALTIHFYRSGADAGDVRERYTLGTKLTLPDDQYRYNTTDNLLTLTGGASGLGAFSSTMEPSSLRFDALFGHHGGMYTTNKRIPGLPELLGGKFYVTEDPGEASVLETVSACGRTWYVCEGEACPIGYSVSSYIPRKKLKKLDLDRRPAALMNTMVIERSEKEKVENDFPEADPASLNLQAPIGEQVRGTVERAVRSFARDAHGFTCRTDYPEKRLVFFTVPWSSGWSAYVDGEEADVINAGGMMGLSVPAGAHAIEYRYHTPGMKEGLILTAAGWMLFLLLVLYGFLRRGL